MSNAAIVCLMTTNLTYDSFNSGRRCETGEGIYAFRCQRAAMLFRTLQQQIQLRNVVHDSLNYPLPQPTPSPTMGHAVVQRLSVDNGQSMTNENNLAAAMQNGVPPPTTQSPRSPSSTEILEVMALNPNRQANGNHVTNVYHLRNFKREHNNNQSEGGAETQHVYCNDLNRDLAILRQNLRQEAALNTMRDIEYETRFLESRYINESIPKNKEATVSPTLSNNSEHYAQLSIEQQQQQQELRLYMNIPQSGEIASTMKVDVLNDGPSTPLTPKQVEYCNLSLAMRAELNTYANLSLGDKAETIKNTKQKCLESNASICLSPTEELVNYAVLDIDTNKEVVSAPRDLVSPESQSCNSSRNESTASYSSQSRGRLVSQSSLEKPPVTSSSTATPLASIGYTTIDFDKTVALTSVAAATDVPRKQRHNSSNVTCSSPSAIDKSKSNN